MGNSTEVVTTTFGCADRPPKSGMFEMSTSACANAGLVLIDAATMPDAIARRAREERVGFMALVLGRNDSLQDDL